MQEIPSLGVPPSSDGVTEIASPCAAAALPNRAEAATIAAPPPSRFATYFAIALIVIAIVYGFLAGFRTVHDYDMGWQLATGRWVLEHHRIPSTDVFSYTARGQSWIYPVLAGIVLYTVDLLGGYSALSWLTALATAFTVFLLTRRRTMATALLAILAVPVIGERAIPRADLFTTVLFAATLYILWEYHRNGQGKLWLLPLITAAWVNLHWGFVAGLALCVAYVLLEVVALPFRPLRGLAKARLRKAWPWLVATLAATVLNPWGPRLFLELSGWGRGLASQQSAWIEEFTPMRLTWAAMQQALSWRQPESAIWWLLGAGLIATVIAVARRQFGSALLLAASLILAVERVRFQALFACVVVLVGGSVLSDAFAALEIDRERFGRTKIRFATALAVALGIGAVGLAGVR